MSGAKIAGGILIGLSILVLLAGVLLAFGSEDSTPSFLKEALVGDDVAKTGYVYMAVGGFLLVGGVVLLLLPGHKTEFKAVVAPRPVAQTVEIKRTQMDFAKPAAGPGSALDEELEGVNQKMGRLKVQFGIGELSSASYQTLMAQLEAEKAAIERKILERGSR